MIKQAGGSLAARNLNYFKSHTKRATQASRRTFPKTAFLTKNKSSMRAQKLRVLLEEKQIVRIMEAHNGLTGLIVETVRARRGKESVGFDGIWGSSLTDSFSKGKPDTAVVDLASRLRTMIEILEVTTKPIIIDMDNGGSPNLFGFTVRTLERLGVSAVVIEDKIGEKRNSLLGTEVFQEQDTIKHFCKKIAAGKMHQKTSEFMIVARIESLILERGMDDALARAGAYIKAGADGVLIHSRKRSPNEILTFCKEYQKITRKIPLFVVPTTYNSITEAQLQKAGVKVVIYANQLLRSAYPMMVKAAETILENSRALEVDDFCAPISQILNLIPIDKKI